MSKYGKYGLEDLMKMNHDKVVHFGDMLILENKIEKDAYEDSKRK